MLTLPVTIGLLMASALLAGWGFWRERRPYRPGSPPLVPSIVLQFIGVLGVILMTAHLISLTSGQPFVGRGGP